MKKVHAIIIVLVVAASAASAQVCTPPQVMDQKAAIGSWQGSYTLSGEMKTINIQIRETNDKLVSYVDMPGYGIKNTLFETKVCGCQELHLKKSDVGKVDLEFVGKPKGDKITGRLLIKKDDQKIGEEVFTVTKVSGDLTSAN